VTVARWALLGCAMGLGLSGCRDLVEPRPAPEDGPEPFVRMNLRGLDPILDRATVRIDNSPYVDPSDAAQWQGESYLNDVRIEGAEPGLYDIHVEPYPISNSTPTWTETAVQLAELPVTVAYPGVPVQVLLDWPELAGLGADLTRTTVRFRYWFPVPGQPGRTNRGSIYARFEEPGVYTGTLPWTGSFETRVNAYGTEFELELQYADSLVVSVDSAVTLASPLRQCGVDLQAHGADFAGDRVLVRQSTPDVFDLDSFFLTYTLDRTTRPGSLLLLDGTSASQLDFSWREGPAFQRSTVYVEPGIASLGVVDLGAREILLRVTDPTGAPLPEARVFIDGESPSGGWYTNDTGELILMANDGPHRLDVEHPEFARHVDVVSIDGDRTLTIALEAN
jgi:hypothetical protein